VVILENLRKTGEWEARAAVALMFFAGLRPGEARGICWEHYDGERLYITQSVKRRLTTDAKTLDRASPVPRAQVQACGPLLSESPVARAPLDVQAVSESAPICLTATREVCWRYFYERSTSDYFLPGGKRHGFTRPGCLCTRS